MDALVEEVRIEDAAANTRDTSKFTTAWKRTVPLSAEWRAAIRWALILIGPIVVSAASAFLGAALMVEPMYAARADLVIQLSAAASLPEQYRATQIVVATGPTVLAPVSDSTGIPVEQLESSISVDFPKGSAVMRLQYVDADKAHAVDTLDQILDQYLSVLGEMESIDGTTHKLLTPPFAIADPVRPRPMQAAAIGAVLGLAISLGLLAFLQRSRVRS